jgi:hypothetical protein
MRRSFPQTEQQTLHSLHISGLLLPGSAESWFSAVLGFCSVDLQWLSWTLLPRLKHFSSNAGDSSLAMFDLVDRPDDVDDVASDTAPQNVVSA